MNIDDDFKVFLDDFAIDFVVGNDVVARRGIFEEENSPITFGVEGRRISLTTDVATASNIHHGMSISTLTLPGKQYTVVGIEPIDDGEFVEIILKV